MSRVITISREFGSGGREIGKRLSDELNIPFYDKEVISLIAKQSGLDERYIEMFSEGVPVKNYPIIIGRSFAYYHQETASDKVYKQQAEFIRNLSEKGDCIIVGRCADYLCKNSLNIMIYGDIETRIERCKSKSIEDEKLSVNELQKKIKAVDKQRTKYYEYYTGQKWGDKKHYDLCINTTHIDIKKAVKSIMALVEQH